MKQSSKNTGRAPAKPGRRRPGKPVGHLSKIDSPTVTDLQVEALQDRLVQLEDERKEERFLWFAVCGALFIVLAFAVSVPAGSVLTVIYLALLLVYSRKWGVEAFWEAMHDARNLFRRIKDDGDE